MARLFLAILLATFVSAPGHADERRTHSIKMKATGGKLEIEVPESWGRKPEIQQGENATMIGFTPLGTPRDPVFRITIVAGVPEETVTSEIIRKSAEAVRDEFLETALEDEVTVNDMTGGKNLISYFTLTDKEIKPREYQYLTAAVVSDGVVVCSFWFFSNDGAPDYAADAMHLMETMRYIPKEEEN